MNEFLQQYPTLYHFSKAENLKSILERGLQPNMYPPNEYDQRAPERRAQVCLCDLPHLESYVQDERANKHPEPIVCVVDTLRLMKLRIGLDWTHSGTSSLFEETSVEPFIDISLSTPGHDSYAHTSLQLCGTLCSFDVIPPSAFMVCTAEYLCGPRPAKYPVRS